MNAKLILLVIVVAALIVIIGYAVNQQSQQSDTQENTEEVMMEDKEEQMMEEKDESMMEEESGEMMEEKEDAMMQGEVKTFNISAFDFNFSIKEIKVKKGDTVKITVTNSGSFHDGVSDGFNVRTRQHNRVQSENEEYVEYNK